MNNKTPALLAALVIVANLFVDFWEFRENKWLNGLADMVRITSHEPEQGSPLTINPPNLSDNNELKIADNGNGQFITTVTINGVTMPALIDTGATETSIPIDMARKAHLPIGEISTARTANGYAQFVSSSADSLILGNFELRNVRVDAMFNLHVALIGMNVLRRFELSTNLNAMRLRPIENGNITAFNEAGSVEKDRARKKRANWKKTEVCDESGYCKTTYSQ